MLQYNSKSKLLTMTIVFMDFSSHFIATWVLKYQVTNIPSVISTQTSGYAVVREESLEN